MANGMSLENTIHGLTLRPATVTDSEAITELTIRSKAWWGYDEKFMQDAAEELRYRDEAFPEGWVYVMEASGALAGFCSLRKVSEEVAELHDLFVHPSWIGRGLGTVLWTHALDKVRTEGVAHLVLNADPHAEGFYRKLGATRIASVASAIRPGRELPVMHFSLDGNPLPEGTGLPGAGAC